MTNREGNSYGIHRHPDANGRQYEILLRLPGGNTRAKGYAVTHPLKINVEGNQGEKQGGLC